MKFRLNLQDGRWVGGFECLRGDLLTQLMDLRLLATSWGQPIVATRVDHRGRPRENETHVIPPVPGLDLGIEDVKINS